MAQTFTVKVRDGVEISYSQISDMLVAALEGGSNYWYFIPAHEIVAPTEAVWSNSKTSVSSIKDLSRFYDYPLNPGGAVLFATLSDGPDLRTFIDTPRYRLDLDAIRRGLTLMADQFPKHMQNLVDGNDDADTADAFLQCALFGELRYC